MNHNKIDEFDRQFSESNRSRIHVAFRAGNDLIYKTDKKHEKDLWPISIGTYLIRSAAAVEQTFNGITTRLWDDPFEWTLPERLPSYRDLIEYFDEVETARVRGFKFLKSDDDLSKSIPAPVELMTLDLLLISTLERSKMYLSSAESMLSNARK